MDALPFVAALAAFVGVVAGWHVSERLRQRQRERDEVRFLESILTDIRRRP